MAPTKYNSCEEKNAGQEKKRRGGEKVERVGEGRMRRGDEKEKEEMGGDGR